MTTPNELLRTFARTGSESAFRELTARYLDMVYSVAVRRLGGDTHLAEDVTQRVFADLAARAGSMGDDVQLGGWLHRHACFISANVVRGERRRQEREREAAEMNLLQSANQPWEDLAPLLDEAIDQLESADREAVILRYFERLDFRAIGRALGVTDDAAQKRVSRAIDRLRDRLAKGGVTVTVAALGTLLGSYALQAAPAGFLKVVSAGAVAKAPVAAVSAGGWTAFWMLLSLWKTKLAILSIAMIAGIAITSVVLSGSDAKPGASLSEVESLADTDSPTVEQTSESSNALSSNGQSEASQSDTTGSHRLMLAIVDADSGNPLPGVAVECRRWEQAQFGRSELKTDRAGICAVPFPPESTTRLRLQTRLEGFADTRLEWSVDRGNEIPASYTVRLVRAKPIGGVVLDADGNPVAGAKVGWNHEASLAEQTHPESHEFSWIETTTDAAGRWRINRIAPEMIRRLYGKADHPEHVEAGLVFVARDVQAERALTSETHVFRLGRALRIWGHVVDESGTPIPEAKVFLGLRHFSGTRETTADVNGVFYLAGCKPGSGLLSAQAPGFSAVSIEVEVTEEGSPYRLVLGKGNVLRLRVVDRSGSPIPGAQVWLETMNTIVRINSTNPPPPVQAEFDARTDFDGRVLWTNAPSGELTFTITSTNHMRANEVKLRADEQEHVVTLDDALTVYGTVRDAVTGRPIPQFRVAVGWPASGFADPNAAVTSFQWSPVDQHWFNFGGGTFRQTFSEPLVYGMEKNPGYGLKFTAEGYAPFISRWIRPDEEEVRLDVSLVPARELTITVLQPDGTPATQVDVGLVTPGAAIELLTSGIDRQQSAADAVRRTDSIGQFILIPDPSITSVVALSAAGFGRARISELKANPIIQMKPFGSIEGVCYSADAPDSGRELTVVFHDVEDRGIQLGFSAFKVRTDGEGRFAFPRVPWGSLSLVRLVPMRVDDKTTVLGHQPIRTLAVEPGKTTYVTIGESSYRITAQIVLANGALADTNASFIATVHSPIPPIPSEIQNDMEAIQRWSMQPEIQELTKSMQHYAGTVSPKGEVMVEDVPAGEYQLTVGLAFHGEHGKTVIASGMSQTRVVVPAEPKSGVLDLGRIVVNMSAPGR